MAREPNNLRLAAPLETEPSFTLTFRGYNKREVDQYAHITETQLSAAVAERNDLAARVRALTDQLHSAHSELVDLRRRPTVDDKVSFRHLGPRVEQILADAEEQADAVRTAAAESLNAERKALELERAKLHESHAKMISEYESAKQSRRAEEEVEIAKRLEAVRVEVSEGQAYARRLRAEAEEIISGAQTEARKLVTDATAQSGKIRADAAEQATALRTKAEEDAASVAQSAEAYAREIREEAEQQAHESRSSAEDRAHRSIEAAEQFATQVRTQAEQHAAQVRAAAEKHASRLHAAGPKTLSFDAGPAAPKSPVPVSTPSSTPATPNGPPSATPPSAVKAGTTTGTRETSRG
jgi:cell division septum initiation protein DivIVA